MRYWTLLHLAGFVLLAPTNLYAQLESCGQPRQSEPTNPPEQSRPCAPSGKTQTTTAYEMAVARATAAIRSYHSGQHLIVLLNNQRERVGKLVESQADYSLLSTSKGAEKIAYVDVAAVKTGRSQAEKSKRILMRPINGTLDGVVYGGFFTLVGIEYLIKRITGHH